MSPRRKRLGARCRSCGAPVVFFRSPFTSNVRTFDPEVLEASHPLTGVKVFPVLVKAAMRPGDLVALLRERHGLTQIQAETEAAAHPHYRLHDCEPTEGTTDA